MWKLLGVLLLTAFSASSLPAQSLCKECYNNSRFHITNFRDAGAIDNSGIANSLLAKLDAAERAQNDGNDEAAVGVLEAFKQEVLANEDRHIIPCVVPDDVVQILIGDADFIIRTIIPCI